MNRHRGLSMLFLPELLSVNSSRSKEMRIFQRAHGLLKESWFFLLYKSMIGIRSFSDKSLFYFQIQKALSVQWSGNYKMKIGNQWSNYTPPMPQIPYCAYGKLPSQLQSNDSLFCFAKWDSFNFIFAVCESKMIPRPNLHNAQYNKFLKSQIKSQGILRVQGCRILSSPQPRVSPSVFSPPCHTLLTMLRQ